MTREDIIPYIFDGCTSYISRELTDDWVPYGFEDLTVSFKNSVTNETTTVTGDSPEGLVDLLNGEN